MHLSKTKKMIRPLYDASVTCWQHFIKLDT